MISFIQAMGDPSQGFVNAILFCLIADKLRFVIQKCLTKDGNERVRLLDEQERIQNLPKGVKSPI